MQEARGGNGGGGSGGQGGGRRGGNGPQAWAATGLSQEAVVGGPNGGHRGGSGGEQGDEDRKQVQELFNPAESLVIAQKHAEVDLTDDQNRKRIVRGLSLSDLGAYGAGLSVYSHFLTRGHDVVFPKDMPMDIGFGARESEAASNGSGPS